MVTLSNVQCVIAQLKATTTQRQWDVIENNLSARIHTEGASTDAIQLLAREYLCGYRPIRHQW